MKQPIASATRGHTRIERFRGPPYVRVYRRNTEVGAGNRKDAMREVARAVGIDVSAADTTHRMADMIIAGMRNAAGR